MVSDFTTTGYSIVTDVDALSNASLFWRSFSRWIGGMGILVFVVAFIPIASGRTLHILKSEMPGPVVGKLVSKIHVTARILYIIYAVLTVIQIILLLFGGMTFFDSLLNAFGTAGTGGFAIKNASIAYYNSAYIDGVTTVFMILFGINFNVIYFFVIGKIVTALKSEELRWYLGIIVASIIGITIHIVHVYSSIMEAFRYASFQVASIITTNYDRWPMFSQMILLIVSLENIDFHSVFGAVTTCLNNVGPGFEIVEPVGNFSSLSDLSKIVLSLDMLLGRLEIFPMLILFSKQLWRK